VSGSGSVFAFAPAKVNLFLHVGDKRADGYHQICSLAAFADIGDDVSAELADTLSLSLSGPVAPMLIGDGDENLVLRAARALQSWARSVGRRADGARLSLHKNLPVASGIGGGSTDAAATLTVLNRLWHLAADDAVLERIAVALGADVPVCLRGVATLMQGVGEKLMEWPALPPMPAVLVNPGVAVATAEVFQGLNARSGVQPPNAQARYDRREVCAFLKQQHNDLEAPAREIAPIIGDALMQLTATHGAALSRMSGSGATCFALYESDIDAAAAAETLAKRNSGWWVEATTLR